MYAGQNSVVDVSSSDASRGETYLRSPTQSPPPGRRTADDQPCTLGLFPDKLKPIFGRPIVFGMPRVLSPDAARRINDGGRMGQAKRDPRGTSTPSPPHGPRSARRVLQFSTTSQPCASATWSTTSDHPRRFPPRPQTPDHPQCDAANKNDLETPSHLKPNTVALPVGEEPRYRPATSGMPL